MKKTGDFPLEGMCSCGAAKFCKLQKPMFVHCCHCSWCQRETGSAFAVNALIESSKLRLLDGDVEVTALPSNSGAGQNIIRCVACKSALWSHYGAARDKVAFVRVGTLEKPNLCPPDIHVYTSTKQQWVKLSDRTPVVEEFYRRSTFWPAEAIARYKSAAGT